VDQDALNVVVGAKRFNIGFKYNFMSTLSDTVALEDLYEKYNVGEEVKDFSEYLFKMSIIHFTDILKPWEYNLPWYTDIFKKYYNMTPYKDETLKLKSPIKWYNSEYVCEDLLIPYKEVGRDSRIVIYGGGKFGKKCMEQLKIFNYGNVVGWVDKYISNDEISSIDRLREMKYDYILIAVKRRATIEEIINELEGTYEIPSEKIVSAFRMFKRY
jgi:lipopolysaccharide biosynthesis glycosyltransferase